MLLLVNVTYRILINITQSDWPRGEKTYFQKVDYRTPYAITALRNSAVIECG